jgi:hypothetical protein
MQKFIFIILTGFLFTNQLSAQSLAINTDGSTASSSALLDVKSTTKGLLIPRMSKTQRNAIASPATGLLVFQNAPDSIGFHYYDGSSWIWLANSVTAQQWLLTGNDINAGEYIGTNNAEALRFFANGFESARSTANSYFWGFGETAPQYNLDVTMGIGAIIPCIRNGLRLKPAGAANDCDLGLFFGLDDQNSYNTASIWNYGNGNPGSARNLRFGLGDFEMARITDDVAMGIGEPAPRYTLDMKIGAAAVNPCSRNGIRINFPSYSNDCERGLFMGYDDLSISTSAVLWNFADGSANPANAVFRFGMGNDMVIGERMRLNMAGGLGLGTTDPLAKIHIVDITASLMPGLMVTTPLLPPATNGMYFGLKNSSSTNEGRVWNYQNADIEFGTNDLQRMLITSSGNVGIATSTTPTSTLQVDGSIAVGVSMAVTGGPVGSPVSLNSYKSYVGLEPTATDNYYQLPNPATHVGRIYYIRNNSNSETAKIGTTAAALICPGNGLCLPAGSYYDLNPTVSVKTVIAISDGINWTLGKID